MGRAITVLLLIYISTITSFGQVLNARGLKVVEKIEVERYNTVYMNGQYNPVSITNMIISLGYNDVNKLTSLNYRTQPTFISSQEKGDSYEKRFTLSNGKLTRKDYENGKLMKDYTFNYVLDGNIITKREVFNHATNGTNECLRSDDEYTYVTDTDGTPILSRDTYKWYVRMPGTTFFQKGDGEDGAMISRYYKENGNFYKAMSIIHNNGSYDEDPIHYQDYEYSDLPNDTNVNLFFNLDYGWEQKDIELLTEWVNVRSEHLLNRYERYEYKYGYENGNISTIEIYRGDRLQAKLTITYKMN